MVQLPVCWKINITLDHLHFSFLHHQNLPDSLATVKQKLMLKSSSASASECINLVCEKN